MILTTMTFKVTGTCEFDGKIYKIIKWDEDCFDGNYEFVRVQNCD